MDKTLANGAPGAIVAHTHPSDLPASRFCGRDPRQPDPTSPMHPHVASHANSRARPSGPPLCRLDGWPPAPSHLHV
jgi:hypothetical protein